MLPTQTFRLGGLGFGSFYNLIAFSKSTYIYCGPPASSVPISPRSSSFQLSHSVPRPSLLLLLSSMPNGPAGAAARLAGNQHVQALVKQLAPALVQKVKAQLNAGQNGQRNGTRNGADRRRYTRNQRALARGAALRSLPRGPVQPKDVRFRGGALSNQHLAPRGQGYYDAFASMPDSAVLSSAVGPCTPIEGFARYIVSGGAGVTNLPYQVVTGSTLTTNITTNAKLVVFNVGSSDSQLAASFEVVNVNGQATIHAEPIHAAAFAELGPTTTIQIGRAHV